MYRGRLLPEYIISSPLDLQYDLNFLRTDSLHTVLDKKSKKTINSAIRALSPCRRGRLHLQRRFFLLLRLSSSSSSCSFSLSSLLTLATSTTSTGASPERALAFLSSTCPSSPFPLMVGVQFKSHHTPKLKVYVRHVYPLFLRMVRCSGHAPHNNACLHCIHRESNHSTQQRIPLVP